MKKIFTSIILLALVTGCGKDKGQNEYGTDEVGKAVTLEYAVVLAVKAVAITGDPSNPKTASVPLAGGMGGSYIGSEIGNLWGTGQGAVEQAAAEKKGYEYIIVTENNSTKTVVQYLNPYDVVFEQGDLVLLQNAGNFHRLISTANLPGKIKNPHRKKIEELTAEKQEALPQEKSTEKPAEKPPEKPVEKVSEKLPEKPAETPADKPAEKPPVPSEKTS